MIRKPRQLRARRASRSRRFSSLAGTALGSSDPGTALAEAAAVLAMRPEYVGISDVERWLQASVSRLPSGEQAAAAMALANAQGTTPNAVTIYSGTRGTGEAFHVSPGAGGWVKTPLQAWKNRIRSAFIPAGFKAKFAANVAGIPDDWPAWVTSEYSGPRWVLLETPYITEFDAKGRGVYYIYADVRDARTADQRSAQDALARTQGAKVIATAEEELARTAAGANMTTAQLLALKQQRETEQAVADATREAQARVAAQAAEAQARLQAQQQLQAMTGARGGGGPSPLVIGAIIVAAAGAGLLLLNR